MNKEKQIGDFVVGTHNIIKAFKCLECAKRFYNNLEGNKYLKDLEENVLIENTYGWENN